MLGNLPFLIPFTIFAVLILVALRFFMNLPDYLASLLQRTWGVDPTSADLLGVLGWVAIGFMMLYFIGRHLWNA